ncbi:unnamed protein product [Prunus brigantina]
MKFKIECGKLQEDIETLQDQVMDLELEIGMLTQDENLEENVERKNRVLIEMARLMLNSMNLAKHFWAEASVIIGPFDQGVRTRHQIAKEISHVCYVSNEVVSCYARRTQSVCSKGVWYLVPRPTNTNIIGTKCIFKNKTDELANRIDKEPIQLELQCNTMEDVDFDETFALVSRLESVRFLLAIACHLNFKLFQMDVKITFLNGILNEEVYVEQPKGFEILIIQMMCLG